MKHLIVLSLFALSFITQVQAQNAAPPSYLTTQDFPDSVKQLTLLTPTGESVTFAEVLQAHKGKKILIDFWASWCRDCIVSIPKLGSLQHKTQKSQVDYVFISVDEKNSKWKSAMKKYALNGDHYRVPTGWESTLTNYIDLDWVPRYIVINKDGRIIFPKTVKIADKKLENVLLGKK